jgi:Putative Flp pilus-assembly TadE/G-like
VRLPEPRDDRGLVGKIVVLWLVVLAVAALLAIDAGSIVLARFRTSDLAEDAATAAAETFEETSDEQAAKLAALETIEDSEDRARLKRIRVTRGEVTVVLTSTAGTIVVGRIPWFDQLAKVKVTESTAPDSDTPAE